MHHHGAGKKCTANASWTKLDQKAKLSKRRNSFGVLAGTTRLELAEYVRVHRSTIYRLSKKDYCRDSK
jgi:hypothetical protein